MKHLQRYRRTWRVLRVFLPRLMRWKLGFEGEVCVEKGTLLVVCNHNTDMDPLLLGCVFPEYMSFVASEHVFRMGLLSKVITSLMAPISRLKGKTAVGTAMTVMRRLRAGVNVAIFAEGDRSFNGLTGPIYPATGRLACHSGATLVTYRLDGGYLTSPRWAGTSLRKGRMTGRVVGIYSPEQLKEMGTEAVNAAISRDLSADAYAFQRQHMVPFRGKALAEHLERVLCLCPRCGRLSTLHSSGDMLRCSCGLAARYNTYGFLEGENLPWDNVTDWDRAQTEALQKLADTAEGCLFSDSDMVLREILPDTHSTVEIGRGEMALYPDRLLCCGREFYVSEIGEFSLHGAQTADFSCGEHSYEISSAYVRCVRKYQTVIRYWTRVRQKE